MSNSISAAIRPSRAASLHAPRHLLLVKTRTIHNRRACCPNIRAIHTASTNGTWVDGEQLRLARLEPGVKVVLADEAGVEWRVLN